MSEEGSKISNPARNKTRRSDADYQLQLRDALSWWAGRTYVQGARWTAKNEGMRDLRVTQLSSLIAWYCKHQFFTEPQRRFASTLIANSRNAMRVERLK